MFQRHVCDVFKERGGICKHCFILSRSALKSMLARRARSRLAFFKEVIIPIEQLGLRGAGWSPQDFPQCAGFGRRILSNDHQNSTKVIYLLKLDFFFFLPQSEESSVKSLKLILVARSPPRALRRGRCQGGATQQHT